MKITLPAKFEKFQEAYETGYKAGYEQAVEELTPTQTDAEVDYSFLQPLIDIPEDAWEDWIIDYKNDLKK